MEKLIHVKPTKEYEKQAIEYIQEFYKYNSEIHGVGGLSRFLEDYDGWLKKIEDDKNKILSEESVPAETFFLVRVRDNKIVGMTNIRLALNEKLKKFGGHIGYSIRPTERRKGYNKVNLYLALLECQRHGIKEVLMDCNKDNIGSSSTMKAFGGVLIREYFNEEDVNCMVQDYKIDVDKAIKVYGEEYKNWVE